MSRGRRKRSCNDEGDNGLRDCSNNQHWRRKRKCPAGKDQPKVSFVGGGGLGLKQEDNYPSFYMAIRATKNIIKNSYCDRRSPPNDEETHNNQPEDSVGDGGRYYDKMGPRWNVWGDDFPSFGAGNNVTKN